VPFLFFWELEMLFPNTDKDDKKVNPNLALARKVLAKKRLEERASQLDTAMERNVLRMSAYSLEHNPVLRSLEKKRRR
jgi:hypothetical protein